MRTINGFTLMATTVPSGDDGQFYEPALRAQRAADGLERLHQVMTQDAITQSQEEAQAAAERWLVRVTSVDESGEIIWA